MPETDPTHDPSLTSWIESANDPESDFPVQNLPFGAFRRQGTEDDPSLGVAIGDQILDLKVAVQRDLLQGLSPQTACALSATTLNEFLKLGPSAWRSTRVALADLLKTDTATLRDDAEARGDVLVAMNDAEMTMPVTVGDYTDFYASLHHATNVGSMFRPDNPLLPNYKHLPVGYHGRASSIVITGTPIRRPMGQVRPSDDEPPTFAPSRLLDYELEMGFLVGPGNELGTRVSMSNAAQHIFGLCIVNDWSARDVQKWEYQPLGPFNAKNFATTISPWIVTLDALAPFRMSGPPRSSDDPPILDYLKPAGDMALDITADVYLSSEAMREKHADPLHVSRGNFADMYWTIAQMLVHHTSTGCNLRPGDLLASGTVSGPQEDMRGCLLERTWRGTEPLRLPDGSERKFLQDGDEVIIRAFCHGRGARRIGFGECRGVILPATSAGPGA